MQKEFTSVFEDEDLEDGFCYCFFCRCYRFPRFSTARIHLFYTSIKAVANFCPSSAKIYALLLIQLFQSISFLNKYLFENYFYILRCLSSSSFMIYLQSQLYLFLKPLNFSMIYSIFSMLSSTAQSLPSLPPARQQMKAFALILSLKTKWLSIGFFSYFEALLLRSKTSTLSGRKVLEMILGPIPGRFAMNFICSILLQKQKFQQLFQQQHSQNYIQPTQSSHKNIKLQKNHLQYFQMNIVYTLSCYNKQKLKMINYFRDHTWHPIKL